MAKAQTHGVVSSFAQGVREGRKEVRDGDYHDAVIGLVVILVVFLAGLYALYRVGRWLLR